MRVEDLRYFEHLAEVLNYTRASKDLEISQPTLSLAIKRLEEEWGVQLFSRNRSTVELTDIGRDISDCVTGALRSLDRARVLAGEWLASKTRSKLNVFDALYMGLCCYDRFTCTNAQLGLCQAARVLQRRGK